METILEQQQADMQKHLEELIKVGVGGKFKDTNNYTELVQEELEFENAMLQGGIDRFRKTITDAVTKNQESTTLHGLVLQQKYITKLSLLINGDIQTMNTGGAGNRLTALKLLCQCLPQLAFKDGKLIKDKHTLWDTCSLITLKNVIDGISNETTLNKLAIKIGAQKIIDALQDAEENLTKAQTSAQSFFEKRATSKNMKEDLSNKFNKHSYNYDDDKITLADCNEQIRTWAKSLAEREIEKRPEGKELARLKGIKRSALDCIMESEAPTTLIASLDKVMTKFIGVSWPEQPKAIEHN